MKRTSGKRTAIVLSLSSENIGSLFNPYDDAPLHERQLEESFASYIYSSAGLYGKYPKLQYKVRCKEQDKELIDPFMYAVRRYFRAREASRRNDFKSFKRKAFKFITAGFLLVAVSQGLLHLFSLSNNSLASIIINMFSVFSWVMFFKGAEIWIFKKRPILKEISLYHKLANAEAVMVKEREAQKQESLDYERAA